MFRRLTMIPLTILLVASLAALPACKKKKTDDGGGDGGGGDPTPGGVPAATTSDYFLFAQLRAKDIRENPVFKDVKDAFTKAGGADQFDKVENEASSELGIKLTDIDSVTVCLTEFPARGPKMVMILTASKPIDKAAAFKLGTQAKPDTRGFYKTRDDELIHFPDDKTLVLLSPDLAQKYLDGYAKNRTGWPLTAELTKAASGHTAYVAVNMDKVPRDQFGGADAKEFAPLLAARTLAVTADLKGKELALAGRATFPDAATAGKAKDTVQGLLGQAVKAVESLMAGKEMGSMAMFMPVVKEGHRSLKAVKLDVSGSDVTIAASYKADFDINAMVADAVKQMKETAPRMTAQNNMKQIGLALLNYESANARLPISGTGATGAAIKNATEKPLLSWRVAILPYIEQDNLYKQFKLNEPWDSATNKPLIEKMPKIFAPLTPGKPGYTHLQMIVGANAMQPGASIVTITDGSSNTIAVAEAADLVIWTKPDDVVLPAKLLPGELKKKFGGQFPGGFNVLMWDGSVRFVKDTVSERTLGSAINPQDGMVLGTDW